MYTEDLGQNMRWGKRNSEEEVEEEVLEGSRTSRELGPQNQITRAHRDSEKVNQET